MTAQRENHHELADRLEALALKLKLHFEQTKDEDVSEALRDLRDSINNAFEATSNAVKDEAIRDDVRDVGRLLSDALTTTVHRATSDVREMFERKS